MNGGLIELLAPGGSVSETARTDADADLRRAAFQRAGWLETFFARRAIKAIQLGEIQPEYYERFSIDTVVFEDSAGLRGGSRSEKVAHGRDQSLDAVNRTIWLCFLGFGQGSGLARNTQRSPSLHFLPRQGTAFVFDGPDGIVGHSPDQCLRSTSKVLQACQEIVGRFSGYRVGVFSFSAGTHLGFYVANQLGRTKGSPVDKFIAISPGESIAYGIFSTWVTTALATQLQAKGICKEKYDDTISEVTQKNNLDYLPQGRDLVIHAGTNDTFIPIDAPGGTNDLVSRLRAKAKNPTYVIHSRLDHVTLPIKLIALQSFGRNPYCI